MTYEKVNCDGWGRNVHPLGRALRHPLLTFRLNLLLPVLFRRAIRYFVPGYSKVEQDVSEPGPGSSVCEHCSSCQQAQPGAVDLSLDELSPSAVVYPVRLPSASVLPDASSQLVSAERWATWLADPIQVVRLISTYQQPAHTYIILPRKVEPACCCRHQQIPRQTATRPAPASICRPYTLAPVPRCAALPLSSCVQPRRAQADILG